MQTSDLKPAGSLAQRFGVKAIYYGKPGTGKTPSTLATAPRPLLLATEPGLKSVNDPSNPAFNVPTWQAYEPKRIQEFFDWFFKSTDVRNFDTLVIDSGSQLAEIILTEELAKQKDGRKAYGELSRRCMEWFDKLYFMEQKHVWMICKQAQVEVGKTVVNEGGAFVVQSTYQSQPFFPGNDLNIKVPHRYDEILHASYMNVPGVVEQVVGVRTRQTDQVLARDRSGRLNEIEPANVGEIIRKCMM